MHTLFLILTWLEFMYLNSKKYELMKLANTETKINNTGQLSKIEQHWNKFRQSNK